MRRSETGGRVVLLIVVVVIVAALVVISAMALLPPAPGFPTPTPPTVLDRPEGLPRLLP